ncbi:hypothetical protein [Aquimarina sp. U1-2]|uniref:hypothetical protein n=1 Tax=Aquimarina sp. U1-2 TaxID=2823141 RepID=UPI001FEEDBB9|nr:hypothetical protein [Aquimarina sp. U1-2]
MYQLAKILETPTDEFLDSNSRKTINQDLKDQSMCYIEDLYQENKEKTDKIIELYEARLKDKDRLIEELEKR